jgi:hypothetical protein
MNHTEKRTKGPVKLVHSLNENDVILGRGQHVRYEGNTRFLNLVRSKVEEYNSTSSKPAKDRVARRIVRDVQNTGGRFVQRFDDTTDATKYDDPNNSYDEYSIVWEIASERTVLVKVKQTFRDYAVIQRKAAAAAAAAASLSTTVASVGTQPLFNVASLPLSQLAFGSVLAPNALSVAGLVENLQRQAAAAGSLAPVANHLDTIQNIIRALQQQQQFDPELLRQFIFNGPNISGSTPLDNRGLANVGVPVPQMQQQQQQPLLTPMNGALLLQQHQPQPQEQNPLVQPPLHSAVPAPLALPQFDGPSHFPAPSSPHQQLLQLLMAAVTGNSSTVEISQQRNELQVSRHASAAVPILQRQQEPLSTQPFTSAVENPSSWVLAQPLPSTLAASSATASSLQDATDNIRRIASSNECEPPIPPPSLQQTESTEV